MELEVTVTYWCKASEFDNLINLYPTGIYKEGKDSDTKWFVLTITHNDESGTHDGTKIVLTWFRHLNEEEE